MMNWKENRQTEPRDDEKEGHLDSGYYRPTEQLDDLTQNTQNSACELKENERSIWKAKPIQKREMCV